MFAAPIEKYWVRMYISSGLDKIYYLSVPIFLKDTIFLKYLIFKKKKNEKKMSLNICLQF